MPSKMVKMFCMGVIVIMSSFLSFWSKGDLV